MNDNRQIISFPFKQHIAHYLYFQLCKKPPLVDDTHLNRPLDIDLNSYDGWIIRLILQKADYPEIKKIEKGFRLWVSIPRNTWHDKLLEDGRYQELRISPDAVEKINGLYKIRFEDHLFSFISGVVFGQGKGGLKNGIMKFIETYQIPESELSYESIRKIYHRHNSPLKTSVYEKKNDPTSLQKEKKPSKDFIYRYIKK